MFLLLFCWVDKYGPVDVAVKIKVSSSQIEQNYIEAKLLIIAFRIWFKIIATWGLYNWSIRVVKELVNDAKSSFKIAFLFIQKLVHFSWDFTMRDFLVLIYSLFNFLDKLVHEEPDSLGACFEYLQVTFELFIKWAFNSLSDINFLEAWIIFDGFIKILSSFSMLLFFLYKSNIFDVISFESVQEVLYSHLWLSFLFLYELKFFILILKINLKKFQKFDLFSWAKKKDFFMSYYHDAVNVLYF